MEISRWNPGGTTSEGESPSSKSRLLWQEPWESLAKQAMAAMPPMIRGSTVLGSLHMVHISYVYVYNCPYMIWVSMIFQSVVANKSRKKLFIVGKITIKTMYNIFIRQVHVPSREPHLLWYWHGPHFQSDKPMPSPAVSGAVCSLQLLDATFAVKLLRSYHHPTNHNKPIRIFRDVRAQIAQW